MKKVLVSGLVIVAFVAYAIFFQKSTPTISTSNVRNNQTSSSEVSGAFKDGNYTGSAADAYYGTIQVKAIIANGKISDVQFLQSPNDQQESIQVNQAAMPNLKQEAIQAQSANVDIVSGATQTSQAFRESLASALSQAK